MDQDKAHDLLIRIDERISTILARMDSGDIRLKMIEDTQNKRPCEVNTDRINKLEKATYGSIFTSILVFCLFVAQWIWGSTLGHKP